MMNALRTMLLLACFLLAGSAHAQITIYRDSAAFDQAHARLRDIDFEDLYSVTAGHILIRNPWGLNCYGVDNPALPDSIDNYLWLGQGATLDFPTRTRRVQLLGNANRFEMRVTDFNDSTFILQVDSFPVDLAHGAGIRRIQMLGRDLFSGDFDINWSAALVEATILDGEGEILGHTDFEELLPEHYYLNGEAHPALEFDSTLFDPLELHGITITEPLTGVGGTFLTEMESRVDPDNPIGNLSVELSFEGTIDFGPGVEGALIVLEAVHMEDTVWFEVSDYAGALDTVMEVAAGHPVLDTLIMEDQQVTHLHLGFGSPAGIRQVRVLGASYFGSVLVGAVHLAEAPRNEIAMIGSVVRSLDTSGFIDDLHAAPLAAQLAGAVADLERNDRRSAIERLERFRSSVAELSASGVLVPEEKSLFMDDAAYVIGRLGGLAGVDDGAGRGDAAAPALEVMMTGGDALELRYDLAPGAMGHAMGHAAGDARIEIHDMRGALVRAIDLAAAHGLARWDLRDAAGARVPSGSYLIALRSGDELTTRLVPIAR